MPELPEVETIARGLASRVTGDVIESVWLGSKPEPLKSPAAEIAATLDGRRIAGVRRVGRLSVAQGFPAAGSEPLDVELEQFISLFRGRKTPIKSALLNQKLLSGVGNIY